MMRNISQLYGAWRISCLAVALLIGGALAWAEADPLDDLELRLFGKKYTMQPLEHRIQRLETHFQQVPPREASLTYRLNRILALPNQQVSAHRRSEAVSAYNRGVDYASQARVEEAIASYQEAIQLDPGLIEAYNNLGHLLQGLNKFEKAMQVYQKALLQAPENGLIHRNLGVVYEKLGRMKDALEEYRRYAQLTGQPDPAVMAILEKYDAEKKPNLGQSDYIDLADIGSQGQKLVWPRVLNPIPVYISLAPDQTPFLPALEESLKEWEAASRGRLRFRRVNTPEHARIRIDLQEGPLSHPSVEVGYASYAVRNNPVTGRPEWTVSIKVNTGERQIPLSLRDRLAQIRRFALHEVGHAVGIWGHSPDPDDIMYSHPIVFHLSERDKNTLYKLYQIQTR